MLEMLKERKAALEARGKKGFTLMEMLIVIAIIAVLVAIAIPVLTTQLERAKEATDAANIRSAYAEVVAAYLNNDTGNLEKEVTLQQGEQGWQSDITLPDNLAIGTWEPAGNGSETVKITATASGATLSTS